MNDYLDFEVRTNDITLNEANGDFKQTVKLMEKDIVFGSALFKGYKTPKWVIRSNVGVLSSFGYNEMVCQFHEDGKVDILEYQPIVRDVFYNLDIRCLSHWCSENGWQKPQPAQRVVDEKMDFWKHQWLTHIIDSPYLDLKYGKRADEDPTYQGEKDE